MGTFVFASRNVVIDIAVICYCRFDVMNSKSYSDQANQYKCPLGRHWQIQEQALIAMLNLMENMVRHALHLLIGYFFHTSGRGGRSANVWIFLSLPLYII